MPPPTHDTRLRFGQFEVHVSEGKLFKKGEPIRLENLPFLVLTALLDRPGVIVSRQELRTRLWPSGTYVDFDEGLNTAIRKLRHSLGDSAETPIFIETLPRRGYRFIAPVGTVGQSIEGPTVSTDENSSTTISSKTSFTPQLGSGNGNGSLDTDSAEIRTERATLLGSSLKAFWQALALPWSRKQLALMALTGFLLVAFLTLLAINRWLTSSSSTLRRETLEIKKLPDTGNVDCVAISPDGRYIVYARRTAERVSLRLRQTGSAGDVEVLAPQEVAFVGLTFSPDGSYIYFVRSDKNDPGYKYLFVMPTLGGPPKKLVTDIDSPVSFSPDGKQFVFTRGIPTKNVIEIHIAEPDGTGDRVLTAISESFAGYQPGATWSPDGRTIAVPVSYLGKTHRFKLFAISLTTAAQHELYSSDGPMGRPLWIWNGNALVTMLHEGTPPHGQLWAISFPDGKKQQRITNDLADYDISIDITSNGTRAVVIQDSASAQLWISPAGNLSHPKQITSSETPFFEAVESKTKKTVALSPGQLWSMNSDGRDLQKLRTIDAVHVSKCAQYIVANVRNNGLRQLVRLDPDGIKSLTLATGNLFSSSCAADGRVVYYADLSPPQRILRISIEGRSPSEVVRIPGDDIVGALDVSQDGRFVAFPWEQFTPKPGVHLEVVSTQDGLSIRSFDAPAGVYTLPCLRWSPDGTAIQYIAMRDGATNLWEQPLGGGAAKQLTRFTSGLIFNFTWTLDGKHLLLSKGEARSDLVMLEHFQ